MTRKRALSLLALLVPLALLVAPRFVFGRGVIQTEAPLFLVHYTSDRPLLARIFDPRVTELGAFRARELSNVVDLGDAIWVDASIRRGAPSFLPPSWLVGVTFVFVVVLAKARRLCPSGGSTAVCALLAVFLSDPVVFLGARVYQKTAKLPVAAALLPFAFFAFQRMSTSGVASAQKSKARLASAAIATAAAFALSLLDEQGAYLALSIGVLALVASAFAEGRRERVASALALLAGCAAGVALGRIHYHVISPWLVHHENGYWPDMSYVGFSDTRLDLQHFVLAAGFLADQASFFLGNMGQAPALLLIAVATIVAARPGEPGFERRLTGALAVVLAYAILLEVMVALMIDRHPPVAEPDVRRGYYGLPALVVALPGALAALEGAAKLVGRSRRAFLAALLFALAGGNAIALPWHATTSTSHHLRIATAKSPELMRILEQRRWSERLVPAFEGDPWTREVNRLIGHYAKELDR